MLFLKMKAFLSNAILMASFLLMVTQMLIRAVHVYLCKDYFENTAAMALFGINESAAVFVLVPFTKTLVTKFGKKKSLLLALVLLPSSI